MRDKKKRGEKESRPVGYTPAPLDLLSPVFFLLTPNHCVPTPTEPVSSLTERVPLFRSPLDPAKPTHRSLFLHPSFPLYTRKARQGSEGPEVSREACKRARSSYASSPLGSRTQRAEWCERRREMRRRLRVAVLHRDPLLL
jgi:hypothetical protein